jgi:glycosyltransferase involved in cell wall biosynthesis
MARARIVAVIPAYNEERYIRGVVEGAVQTADHVIVVDDGSADMTGSAASLDGSVRVVRHGFNMGVGAALDTGVAVALRLKPQVIVTLDGDGQHDPLEIPSLAEPVLSGRAHVAVGCRDFERMSLPRRLSNALTAELMGRLFHVDLPDVQCGYRALRADAAPLLRGWDSGYPWACDMLIRARRLDLRMTPVPIGTVRPGHSHVKPIRDTLRFLNMVWNRSRDGGSMIRRRGVKSGGR